jgi:ATP-dependent DNA helicase DinG
VSDIPSTFAVDGPLARAINGFTPRAQQTEMAERVAAAIAQRSVLVVEAGHRDRQDGMLISCRRCCPAPRSSSPPAPRRCRTSCSSATCPRCAARSAVPVTIALLKGRANYLCHYHLEHVRCRTGGCRLARTGVAHLQADCALGQADRQRRRRRSAPTCRRNRPPGPSATSTRDNCLGTTCVDYDRCFVMAARREALAADVVVVNHHLFFADVMLRDEGLNELLPACNAVILDEAHQLPDTATLFFGESVSTAQMLDLARDARVAALAAAKDDTKLPLRIAAVEKAARDLRLALPREGARRTEKELRDNVDFRLSVAGAETEMAQLAAALDIVAERDKSLESCAERAGDLLARLRGWRGSQSANASANAGDEGDEAGDLVRWAEAYTQSLVLHASPLHIGPIFRRQLQGRPRAWIFTSATLAVGGNFKHYLAEMGLDDPETNADTACWESPFDYQNNGLFYLPKGLPDPNSREHTEAVVNVAMPAIRASHGRAFLLFTTLRAMRYAHELLAERFKSLGLELPLMVQGEGSRSELLERFRRLGNAVLVASSSFWEGVDVRGEALSLVIIDKLPFAPPDDPVLEARLETDESRRPQPVHGVPVAAGHHCAEAGRRAPDPR